MNFTRLNCTTCRYELSQCLDGRLPSGRRSEVMNHAESCAACGSFWLELQAAQELTLSLRATEVSSDFREGLWARIHAGEGTPSAVFQEQIPLWSKVRYTLTGAAAAAALLIGVTFLMKEERKQNTHQQNTADLAQQNGSPNGSSPTPSAAFVADGGVQSSPVHGTLEARQVPSFEFAANPLMSSAKQLDMTVLAVETARQLEDYYANAAAGMRMMSSPDHDRGAAINQVIESAHEMLGFGELLLDLRDRQHLIFTDPGTDADLQFAVNMLAQTGADEQTGNGVVAAAKIVEAFVAPVLRRGRLAHVSRALSLKVGNEHTEQVDLWRVTRMRPELMSKLFVTLSNIDQFTAGTIRPGGAFMLKDDCEFIWVAPRSEVNRSNLRIQIQREHR